MEDVTRWLQKHRAQLKIDPSGSLTHIQAHRDKLQVLESFTYGSTANGYFLVHPNYQHPFQMWLWEQRWLWGRGGYGAEVVVGAEVV